MQIEGTGISITGASGAYLDGDGAVGRIQGIIFFLLDRLNVCLLMR
jgi:hypothetical protein